MKIFNEKIKEPYNGNFYIIKKLNDSNPLKMKYNSLLKIKKMNGLIETFKNANDIITIDKKYYNIINRCYLLKIYEYIRDNNMNYIMNEEEIDKLFSEFVNNPDKDVNKEELIINIKIKINEYIDKSIKLSEELSKKYTEIKEFNKNLIKIKQDNKNIIEIKNNNSKFNIEILEKINVF